MSTAKPTTGREMYPMVYNDVTPDDTAGFIQIFDGKTLAGWEGDTRFWRVERGAIVGETAASGSISENTFLIWCGGKVSDFELKVEFRMNGGNSGIQYRSVQVPAPGKWHMTGYQADIDFDNFFTGNVHDEDGRHIAAEHGQMIRAVTGPGFRRIASIIPEAAVKTAVKANDWNHYHIIAIGPVLMQVVNGQLISLLLDEDTTRRALTGLIGLQLHVGDAFKIEFRNIWLKTLEGSRPA